MPCEYCCYMVINLLIPAANKCGHGAIEKLSRQIAQWGQYSRLCISDPVSELSQENPDSYSLHL